MLKILAFACCSCVALSAYPTTFPYENESYIPRDLIEATPNFTYEPETDTGGYFWHYCHFRNLDEVSFPFSVLTSGYFQYMLVHDFSVVPPVLPFTVSNCTTRTTPFSDSDFTGVVNGKRVCTSGECCKTLVGQPRFSKDQIMYHEWIDNLVAGGMCGDVSETIYCEEVGGHFQTNCFEWYPSAEERIAVLACPQYHIMFWMSCPVFKPTGVEWGWSSEPPLYLDQLDVEQKFAEQILNIIQDRVCHPYSYFYPEEAATSSTNNSDAQPSSSSSSTESGAALLSALSAFVMIV